MRLNDSLASSHAKSPSDFAPMHDPGSRPAWPSTLRFRNLGGVGNLEGFAPDAEPADESMGATRVERSLGVISEPLN